MTGYAKIFGWVMYGAICAVIGIALGEHGIPPWSWTNSALAQQKTPAPKPVQAPNTWTVASSKVVVKKSGELHKFPSPVLRAPAFHPSPIAGHTWHWHALHGWVALPTGTAQLVELGPTFTLPATVQVLEVGKTEAIVTCPRTGLPLKVILEAP